MNRQNLFSDAWDEENEEAGTRHRIFWRPDDARMGATLHELGPDAAGMRMHMHFGAEEMFFVLSGRPVFRNHHGEEELAPGDFVFCPGGTCRTPHVQQPHRRTRSDPRDQCRELPGRGRLPRTRICMGGDSRSRSQATRERRRPRHNRSLRDPDRVIARPHRPSPEPKRPRERPLRFPAEAAFVNSMSRSVSGGVR
jgi:Cupin domain